MELVQDARNSDEVQKALALVDGLEVVWPSEAECQTALEEFHASSFARPRPTRRVDRSDGRRPWRRPQHVQRAALPHVPQTDDRAALWTVMHLQVERGETVPFDLDAMKAALRARLRENDPPA
jgi:hypothetical protein